jgi:prophage regulatory protein
MFKTIKDVASAYKVSPCTIRRWVRNGAFPKPIRMSYGTIRYLQKDIDAWEASMEASSTKKEKGAEAPSL